MDVTKSCRKLLPVHPYMDHSVEDTEIKLQDISR